jgi:hypothetical protein
VVRTGSIHRVLQRKGRSDWLAGRAWEQESGWAEMEEEGWASRRRERRKVSCVHPLMPGHTCHSRTCKSLLGLVLAVQVAQVWV